MLGSGPGGRWFKSIRPDHLFRISNLQNIKLQRAPSAGLRCRWLKSICLNHLLSFQINALHSVLDYEFYFILRTTRTTSLFFVSVWQTAILLSVGRSEKRKS